MLPSLHALSLNVPIGVFGDGVFQDASKRHYDAVGKIIEAVKNQRTAKIEVEIRYVQGLGLVLRTMANGRWIDSEFRTIEFLRLTVDRKDGRPKELDVVLNLEEISFENQRGHVTMFMTRQDHNTWQAGLLAGDAAARQLRAEEAEEAARRAQRVIETINEEIAATDEENEVTDEENTVESAFTNEMVPYRERRFFLAKHMIEALDLFVHIMRDKVNLNRLAQQTARNTDATGLTDQEKLSADTKFIVENVTFNQEVSFQALVATLNENHQKRGANVCLAKMSYDLRYKTENDMSLQELYWLLLYGDPRE